mgnify:FL=1
MFADTDFILALVKDSDWLKDKAAKLLKVYEGKIGTSMSVMIEVALICKRLKINAIGIFSNVFELVNVDEETYAICMRAALYIEKYELNVFDAFHAAYCGNDKIISSDSVYEKVGIERIKLEK